MDLRCDGCGMVRDIAEGSPCADAVCAGTFQRTSEPRGAGGSLGPPAALVSLAGVVFFIVYELVTMIFGP